MGTPGEKHWPVTCHWQMLSYKIVSRTISPLAGITQNFCGDRHGMLRKM
jgi:hypothetical protein